MQIKVSKPNGKRRLRGRRGVAGLQLDRKKGRGMERKGKRVNLIGQMQAQKQNQNEKRKQ